jgi:peptidoglycan/LPS O-acetylase OafA/YrhL
MGDRQHKIQFADTLRGIAAALVMLDHGLGLAGLSPTTEFPLLSLGQFGVALFFLVSGFVIPISLPKYSVAGFLAARVFRIYWTSIAAFAIALVVADKIGTAWSGAEALQYFLIVRDFFGPQTLHPVIWTLEVELKFYLVCALFVIPLRSMRPSYLFLPFALLIVSAAISKIQSGYAWNAVATGGMMIGYMSIGTAVYFHQHNRITTPVLLVISTFLCLGTWLVWAVGPSSQFSHLAGNYAAAAVVFLGCYFLQGRFRKHLVLSALSEISYPLYVVHLPILMLAADLNIGFGLWVGAAAAVVVAAILHWVIERPSRDWGRRIAARLTPPASDADNQDGALPSRA